MTRLQLTELAFKSVKRRGGCSHSGPYVLLRFNTREIEEALTLRSD
jgi:hypothetical protein